MSNSHWETLRWEGDTDGRLLLLDQTKLPLQVEESACTCVEDVWQAIRRLSVRGAPAIGIAAAYGVVLGVRRIAATDPASFANQFEQVIAHLQSSRPTAVNLFWALQRMQDRAMPLIERLSVPEVLVSLLDEARAIHEADRAICRAIGRHGAALFTDGMSVLTHCNAGALATSEYGTALAVIYAVQDAGKRIHVYADETRPLLQGARLTAWELMQRGVPVTLICDSMAAQVMREGRVQAVITGADRITANGDTANKIGTYGVALLARAHEIPFYVAAPSSTFDLSLAHGDLIPIEQRPSGEVTCGMGKRTAPEGVAVYNPAFDVTPAELITAFVTERGVIAPATAQRIAEVL